MNAARNIAFRRAVYQSSAADFTRVGHLATDRKQRGESIRRTLVRSEFPDNSPATETPSKAIDGLKDTKWLVFFVKLVVVKMRGLSVMVR